MVYNQMPSAFLLQAFGCSSALAEPGNKFPLVEKAESFIPVIVQGKAQAGKAT